jgi:hypothetical protein
MKTACPVCDASLTSRELAEGWCNACGKKLPVHLTCSAGRRERRTASAPVAEAVRQTALPRDGRADEPLTAGQKFLIGLAILAALFVIGSALMGDPKSIRALGRVAGCAVGLAVVVGLRGLWRLIRGDTRES